MVKLREMLLQYITARENTEKSVKDSKESTEYKLNKVSQRETENPRNHRIHKMEYDQRHAQALAAAPSIQRKCRYCAKAHWSDDCLKYKTIEERKACLKKSCFKCLKEGHLSHECKSINKKCVHCGVINHHHRSLCPKKFQQRKETNRECVMLSEEINETQEEQLDRDESVLLASGEKVIMQTATSSVANPKTKMVKDVQILLDTGSQHTYMTERKQTSLVFNMKEIKRLNKLHLVVTKAKY
ncbi:hypothetical protein DPMN_090168 [Dreissena polymorpha]|uniref:CCHC-type domain-containing protein n=1 Tax=Dreissena polymorpha TaxID=45954 RepID=A0A9D4KXP4_DREPO|nr:hypothetical protein DPMN_090168 [Dreissena polymorpha]